MTDYERGVEQASAIYKEVIREYVAENTKLHKLVRIMAYCMHDGRECDQCALNGADMNVEVNQLLACDELYRRIMEVMD